YAPEHAELYRHPLHHRDDPRDLRTSRHHVPRPGPAIREELGDHAVLRVQPGGALLQGQLLLPDGPDHGDRLVPAFARVACLGARGRLQPTTSILMIPTLSAASGCFVRGGLRLVRAKPVRA